MAKLAAKKKPTKPDAPKKPSSRSKTGNAECSQAASNWQLSIRGKATLNPGTYQTLAKCRALSKSGQMADAQGRTGKLSDQGAAALKGRLQKRFDSGLITQKSRQDRLETLLKQRSQQRKPTPPPAVQAAPQPARYSLGGQLAPGRGTEERKDAADSLKRLRKPIVIHVLAEKAFSPTEYVDKYGGGSGIMIPKPFDHNAAREKVARQMGLDQALNRNRKKARTLTRKANKLAR